MQAAGKRVADWRVAFDAENYLGETPIWSAPDQALWWVNCEHPAELHRWEPASGAHKVWPMPRRIGGFVPKAAGGLLVVLADGLYDFDVESGALTPAVKADVADHVTLHECHCDRQGRFWVGGYDHRFTPTNRDAAGTFFYRLDGATLTPVIDRIAVANGLAFSPDGKTMYAASSPSRRVEAFDIDPATGAISNRRVFLTLDGKGHIDGATVDAEGGYWLAVVGTGELRRYLPDGTLDRTIMTPCSNPTKPAFGGPDLGTLYITSTKMTINPDHPGNALNGAIYAIEPGVKGVEEVPFSG